MIWLGQISLLAFVLLVGCEITAQTAQPHNPTDPVMARCLDDVSAISEAARESLDESFTAVLMAQARQESGCNPYAASRYAVGYMQFTPATGADKIRTVCDWYGKPVTKAGRRRLMRRKDWSIRCGAKYMSQLWSSTRPLFDPLREEYAAALASYNGGLGWIIRERRIAPVKTIYFGGVDQVCLRAEWACRENHSYPDKILNKWLPMFEAYGVPSNEELI